MGQKVVCGRLASPAFHLRSGTWIGPTVSGATIYVGEIALSPAERHRRGNVLMLHGWKNMTAGMLTKTHYSVQHAWPIDREGVL